MELSIDCSILFFIYEGIFQLLSCLIIACKLCKNNGYVDKIQV